MDPCLRVKRRPPLLSFEHPFSRSLSFPFPPRSLPSGVPPFAVIQLAGSSLFPSFVSPISGLSRIVFDRGVVAWMSLVPPLQSKMPPTHPSSNAHQLASPSRSVFSLSRSSFYLNSPLSSPSVCTPNRIPKRQSCPANAPIASKMSRSISVSITTTRYHYNSHRQLLYVKYLHRFLVFPTHLSLPQCQPISALPVH